MRRTTPFWVILFGSFGAWCAFVLITWPLALDIFGALGAQIVGCAVVFGAAIAGALAVRR